MTVTLYTKSACVQCTATKRKLRQHSIPFVEINLETDPDALAYVKSLGYQSAPVIITALNEHFSGYRPDLLKLLAIKEAHQ